VFDFAANIDCKNTSQSVISIVSVLQGH